MANFRVTLSPNALEAYLEIQVADNESYPDVQIVHEFLKQKGIRAGIDKAALMQMCEEKVHGRRIVVARGKAAVPGRDAEVEFLVDNQSRGKPRELMNGRVDHKELHAIVNVSKGTPLLRIIPPEKGIAGLNVRGEPIEAPLSKKSTIKPGENVSFAQNDPSTLVACENGALSISPDGIVSVVTKRAINGDVDYSTGNVKFKGDLEICGTVKSGFTVQVDGNLTVKGSIEEAEIECGGNCRVVGGIVGGSRAQISCGGSLKARYAENCTIDAKSDITFIEHCINSKISAGGSFRAQTVLGGRISVADEIFIKTIGAATETKTFLDIGAQAEIVQSIESRMKEMGHLASEIQNCKEELFLLVRHGMNDSGKLPHNEEMKVNELKSHIYGIQKEYNHLSETVEQLKAGWQNRTGPSIHAEEIQPNTIIQYGEKRKLINTLMTNILVTVKENRLVFAKV